MKPEPIERIISSILAASIPAAAGMALLITWPVGGGNGSTPGNGNGLLVVEMVPLERLPTPATADQLPRSNSNKAVTIPLPLQVASKPRGEQLPVAPSPGTVSLALSNAGQHQSDATSDFDGSSAISYRDVLLAHVARHRRYPADARREQIQGTVEVRFVLDRAGKVHGTWVVSSSGRMILDEEALATIRRATPMPRIPAGLPSSIDITLPIDFEIG